MGEHRSWNRPNKATTNAIEPGSSLRVDFPIIDDGKWREVWEISWERCMVRWGTDQCA